MAGPNFKHHKPYFFITVYVLVLAGLATFGYFEGRHLRDTQNEQEIATHQDLPVMTSHKSFYRLPRMDLTLSSLEGQTHHARIGISLQIDKMNMDRFGDYQPRVSDRIIDFLRHQNIQEISKPSAMFGLRRDLLDEINDASDPILVSDIVFREFVVR